MSEVAAGWYRDPGNPRRLRYHDGEGWTERSKPVGEGLCALSQLSVCRRPPERAQAPVEAVPLHFDPARSREHAVDWRIEAPVLLTVLFVLVAAFGGPDYASLAGSLAIAAVVAAAWMIVSTTNDRADEPARGGGS